MSERSEATQTHAVHDAAPVYPVAPDDVPPGYKRTEVGTIPKDWVVRNIGDLGQIRRGASPRPIADPKWFDAKSDIGWLRISDVAREGKYIRTTDQSLSDSGVSRSRLVEPGNVIMSMAATVGRPAINQKPVCIHDGFVVFEKPSLSPEFFYYLLLAVEDKWAERGQTGSQINLNTHLIGYTPVPLPESPDEQHAIATALSDADALIESLDRLIAKKRVIKQAAMQQLLTGETRLPGFSSPWKKQQLGDYCRLKSGEPITSSRIADHSQYPCYGGNGLRGFTNTFTHEGSYALIGRQGALCGNVFQVSGRFFASEHALVVTANTQTDISWLAVVLERMELNKYSESSAQPGLSAKKLLLLEVYGPSSKKEQSAIANLLSDIDAEIELLERRRDKARQIKQGMMQHLLTGRVRLPLDEYEDVA